tara:strand:+ start:43 stop:528 length:486 start_codon:yes stop_codon:yes gene_type:complete
MPYKDKEEKKEYQRIYYQNNREKLKEQTKEYNQNNKEQIAERAKERYENNKEKRLENKREYYQNNKEQIAEKKREYDQTPAGKKLNTMRVWRRAGVKNVNEKLYNDYIVTTKCESCSNEFSSSFDRCLDHDHKTGEFRWVICRRCNNHDNWKKIIRSESQH